MKLLLLSDLSRGNGLLYTTP